MAAGEVTPSTAPWVAARVRTAAAELTFPRFILRYMLEPLASLKLTVALLSLATLLVFFGTMAQWQNDIWQVVAQYFRTWVAVVDLQIFFPPSFFPSHPTVWGWFPFPGGKLIGTLMAVNLLTAHGIRFKVQASGVRLKAGLAIILAGCLMTWLVILGGSNKDGVLEFTWITWGALWNVFIALLTISLLAAVAGIFMLPAKKNIERAILIGVATVLGAGLGYVLYMGDAAQFKDASMRILWQLMKGSVAGLVLLAGCALVFKKRAGVVLLHGGLGLLMLNEVVVSTSHVETQMQLDEGQTLSYVHDIRTVELAVIDPSPKDHDDVTVVPKVYLTGSEVIENEHLPFDIQVVKFLQNSDLRPIKAGEKSEATAGIGLEYVAEQHRAGAGTDNDSKVDMSAAYVRFIDKKSGESLGTHLVPLVLAAQNIPEKVAVGDKEYDVYLRFKRYYKPYSVELLDVAKDDYPGTDIPRNYSSDIHLVDAGRNVDRKLHIRMNEPLRYADETFYQSGYHKDPSGKETTTLAVVSNTGWMIPYISCTVVAIGMLAHFMIVLLRFLNRLSTEGLWSPKTTSGPAWSRVLRFAPLVVVVVCAAWLASKARMPNTPEGDMNLVEFGKLPLKYEGRDKPFDTVARNSLAFISERQTFKDEDGQTHPAIRWLLDVVTGSEAAVHHKVFRIDNLEVLDLLNLERRKGFLYALEEFRDRAEEFEKQVDLAEKVPAADRSVFHKKLIDLDRKVKTFTLLRASFVPPPLPSFPTEEEFKKDREAVTKRMAGIRESLQEAAAMAQQLAKMRPPAAVPVDGAKDEWEPYSRAYVRAYLAQITEVDVPPATYSLSRIFHAYARDDAKTFNSEVAAYQKWFAGQSIDKLSLTKVNFEAFFNHFEPFYYLLSLYVIAFLLTVTSWLSFAMSTDWLGRPLNRAAFWLIAFTFVAHTLAIVGRIYISGRPPVTNLYSSAVFIGWGAVALGMILEGIFRIGVGNALASTIGFATLVIAHKLAAGGDTFVVLQAVLDTQFWLATHVVCITLGYATTYVAGVLGIIYILGGLTTPFINAKVGRILSGMIYGVLCFAIFFSFVGTVLGGLWADDSWGRFWGWDPKENGALMIVLWNAIVLHARWGKMVQDRGLAMLAAAGNIIVSWSWFGVNELGVGLHSYGFTEGVMLALGIAVACHLALIGVASLPKNYWWSHTARQSA